MEKNFWYYITNEEKKERKESSANWEMHLLKSWKDAKLLVIMFTGNYDKKLKENNSITVSLSNSRLTLNTSLLLHVFVIKIHEYYK